MILTNKKTEDLDQFMVDLKKNVQKRREVDSRMESIKREIRMLSKHRESIERSRDTRKIGIFNKRYIALLAELSMLIQKNGTSNRDEAAKIIQEIKKH